MRNQILLYILINTLLFSCKNREKLDLDDVFKDAVFETVDYYENGKIKKLTRFFGSKSSNGEYFTYYENGNILRHGYITNGRPIGKFEVYSEIDSGKLMHEGEEILVNGEIFTNVHKNFDNNGNLIPDESKLYITVDYEIIDSIEFSYNSIRINLFNKPFNETHLFIGDFDENMIMQDTLEVMRFNDSDYVTISFDEDRELFLDTLDIIVFNHEKIVSPHQYLGDVIYRRIPFR